jgi:hypothetical protein
MHCSVIKLHLPIQLTFANACMQIHHGGKIEKEKPLEFEKIVHLRKKMLNLPSPRHGRRGFSTKAQHQSSI